VRPPRRAAMVLVGLLVVGLLAALLAVGWIPRERVSAETAATADAALNAPVPVNVIHATQAPAVTTISLPGNLRPWQEVSIFARTTGYMKGFYVDISNQVKAGQLMADVDTPEVDQQLKQAQAAVLQAKAAALKAQSDLGLAQVTYNRYEQLSHTGSVTQQDLDTARSTLQVDQANLEAAKANIAAAEANVNRLTQMVSFEKVTAPFDGVVTGRTFDAGALINADPTSADIKPMFKIAENDVLRVFVNVPQSCALQIRKGMQVKLTARELPGRTFTGSVMGTTNYLDQTNRTLLTEVKVKNEQNADGTFALLPGMYVSVDFELKRDKPPLVIPAPALVYNADGTQVAIVQDGKVHFVKVDLGNDSGNEVEIVNGLSGDEQIIATPGERIAEGVAVKVVGGDEEPKKD
jgi:RND family efflux transporter MFP subunit